MFAAASPDAALQHEIRPDKKILVNVTLDSRLSI
jgi:hypothetical protein